MRTLTSDWTCFRRYDHLSDSALNPIPPTLQGHFRLGIGNLPSQGLVSCVWFGYSTIPNLQCKRDGVF